jgi:creatinine amidohydrolase/Fe(II)-dependent formamide hydrolase-like protein
VSVTSDVFLGLVRQVAESAAVGGFRNIFLMGDHGGGQAELKLAAESLDADWKPKGVRVFYVSDLQGKAAAQIAAYLAERKIPAGGHAGVAESAQVMALDTNRTMMRPDGYRIAAAGPTDVTGTSGDPSLATPEMGRVFLDYKVAAAVDQIRQLLAQK